MHNYEYYKIVQIFYICYEHICTKIIIHLDPFFDLYVLKLLKNIL